jgi:hypothetical protein
MQSGATRRDGESGQTYSRERDDMHAQKGDAYYWKGKQSLQRNCPNAGGRVVRSADDNAAAQPTYSHNGWVRLQSPADLFGRQ